MDYFNILQFDWRIFGQPGIEAMKDLRDMNLANKSVVVENGFALKEDLNEIPGGDQFIPGDQFMGDSII